MVVVEWANDVDIAGLDAHFAELTEMLGAHPGPFVVVVDTSGTGTPDARIRGRAGEHLKGLSSRFQRRAQGIAYVVPSAVIRGAVTAIHWIARVEVATTAVATRAEAIQWAEKQLTRAPSAL